MMDFTIAAEYYLRKGFLIELVSPGSSFEGLLSLPDTMVLGLEFTEEVDLKL